MKTFGLAGYSGSGKTTLLVRLLPILVGRGWRVSTIKHAHHDFDVDTPGKDSFEHRAAGATEVLVSSAKRWALMHEHRNGPEAGLSDLLAHMSPVDLVLIEGFKTEFHDKLEVHRPAIGKPLLCATDTRVVAVASDEALPALSIPKLDLGDVPRIADFILGHCGFDEHCARAG